MPKYDLVFSPPLMNAAGMLGFAPEPFGPVDLGRLGAFVTNPISFEPRSPAGSRCVIPFAGGFLLHSGYPNPGLKRAIRQYAGRWLRSPLPILVHLLASDTSRHSLGILHEMASRLEQVVGVMGLEISIPIDADYASAAAIAQAVVGELPVILRFPLDRVAGFLGSSAALVNLGLAGVSLGPPRGALPLPGGSLVHGRLLGPALFPQALAAVHKLTSLGVPVFGAGGVYRLEQIDQMLAAGASAVQLDAVLWREGIPQGNNL